MIWFWLLHFFFPVLALSGTCKMFLIIIIMIMVIMIILVVLVVIMVMLISAVVIMKIRVVLIMTMILFPNPRVVWHVTRVSDDHAGYGDHDDQGGCDHGLWLY